MSNTPNFDNDFLQAFDKLGSEVHDRYKPTIQTYKQYIIPFQLKRMKDNQNLSFKNTSLQHDKIQLLSRIQQLSSQTKRSQYIMQHQQNKFHDLQRKYQNLQKLNNQNLSIIQAMKMMSTQMQQSLDQKVQIIKQVEQDKSQVLQDIQTKKKQYNSLLQNYMRDKNSIADKLNYMNQLELALLEKDKKIKQEQFYLKKQWEQFQESKKNSNTPQQSIIPNRTFRKTTSGSSPSLQQKSEEKDSKASYQRNQILRNPVKKVYKHHNSQIYDLSFNYNGNYIATCGGDRQIKIYDVLSNKAGMSIASTSAENIYISLALDYGGEKVLAGSTNNSVHIFSTSTGKQLHSFVGHGYKINAVAWSCSKQKCVSASDDKQIKVWQIQKAVNLQSINTGRAVKTVTCNSVEPITYSGHSDGSVRIYSLTQGSNPISQVRGIIDYPINNITLLANRHQVLVSSQQGYCIHLIDFKMNKAIKKYEHKNFFNTSVRADISPSENYIVAGNCDGDLYYWSKQKTSFDRKVSGHESSVTTLKYHFLSGVLASCDKDGSVILWQ